MIDEKTKSRLWEQAVVHTGNHFYYFGNYPVVTGDMIKCETDREYARLLKSHDSPRLLFC